MLFEIFNISKIMRFKNTGKCFLFFTPLATAIVNTTASLSQNEPQSDTNTLCFPNLYKHVLLPMLISVLAVGGIITALEYCCDEADLQEESESSEQSYLGQMPQDLELNLNGSNLDSDSDSDTDTDKYHQYESINNEAAVQERVNPNYSSLRL